MTTRECEFCRDWTQQYLEEYHGVSDMECGACHGTKELDSTDCFCCAYEPGECCCDCDWSDDILEDYYNWEEQDYEENRYMYEYDLEDLEEMSKREKM